MKWKLGLLIVLLLCVVMVPVTANAETSGDDGNIHWVLSDDGVLTISGNGPMKDYSETYVNTKDVTDAPWGYTMTSIIIEDGVTSIGQSAFYGCRKLTNITIPNSVTSIGSEAFRSCSSLTSIMIPDSVTNIWAFAFYNCSSLTSITLPEGVTGIEISAFSGCTNLTNITLPDSVTFIGGNAFYNCTSLTGITIPDSVTSIDSGAFRNCRNLTSVALPEGVTSIGIYAFDNCSSLTSVTIPEGVTSIGDYVFYSCSSLTSITIPDSVTSIGNDVFTGCSSLTSITIPDGVTSIGYGVFSNCSSLTSITIPDSVTSIGDSAFRSCSSLTSITIPDGVTSIGDSAFRSCSNLTSITIPEGVMSIGNNAFSDCSAVRYASVGSDGAKALGQVGYSFRDGQYSKISLLYYFNNGEISNFSVVEADKDIETITFPDSLTSIGEQVFYGCSNLTSISIPEGVTSIGDRAFASCDSLNSAYFHVMDEDAHISFGTDIFGDHKPTIYCHLFTEPYTYFINAGGYTVTALEDIEVDSIRTITLPRDFRMPCGDSVKLSYDVFPVDGAPITWTSSNPEVLTVADGTVTALNPGTATVIAAIGTVSESVTIETYRVATGLVLNETQVWLQAAREGMQLSVAGYIPTDANADITWSSSDTSRATVNSDGYVTTTKPGTVTITATTEKGVTASCELILTYPVTSLTLAPATASIFMGESLQLTATAVTSRETFENKLVTFTSSDETIAIVDSTGLVTATHSGTVTITASTANGKTATAEIIVQYTNHIPVIDEAVEPTCTETGLTEGSHCENCGEVLIPQEEIPALGHDWSEPEYTWAEDFGTVTASRVCNRDDAHIESETVSVMMETTATCTEDGISTYTSQAFANPAFVIQRMEAETPALGHDSITDPAKYVTCTEPGLTEGSHCQRCGEILVAQEEIPAPGHDMTQWQERIAPGEGGSVYGMWIRTCIICGHTENYMGVAAPCDQHIPEEKVTQEPTCTQPGIRKIVCSVCGTDMSGAEEIPPLGHDWDAWAILAGASEDSNRFVRWCKRCMQAEMKMASEPPLAEGENEHTPEEIILSQPTCTESGRKQVICAVCSAQLSLGESIPALGHDWGEATYTWSASNDALTASHVCKRDPAHSETETVSTARSIVSPTMENKGKAMYASDAFENASFGAQLLEITLPALGQLQLLRLPSALTTIEDEAFSGAAFEAVIIPDGCTAIGSRAFANCPNLIYVRIPASVTSIAEDAFEGCSYVVIDRVE